MLNLVITVDYELPAGGRGDVREHMIAPTRLLLDACERYGARLTVMLEIGELWAFRDARNRGYAEHLGYDPAAEIEAQLRDVVARGHDVQLHLHPQWVDAQWNGEEWSLRYDHYHLTDLDPARAVSLLARGRAELEGLLRPVVDDYACVGFRAGHWNTSPSDRYLELLRAAGFSSDTSVFRGGFAQSPMVRFDYRASHSRAEAWLAAPNDINAADPEGHILECPIAAEMVALPRMLTPKRLFLALSFLREDNQVGRAVVAEESPAVASPRSFRQRLARFTRKRSKKLDFCKLTPGEMVRMVRRIAAELGRAPRAQPVPIVMIGHSKQVGAHRGLAAFLRSVQHRLPGGLDYTNYRDFVVNYRRSLTSTPPDRNAVGAASNTRT